MALIECPDCHKHISDESDHCIFCGWPVKKLSSKKEAISPEGVNYSLAPKATSAEQEENQIAGKLMDNDAHNFVSEEDFELDNVKEEKVIAAVSNEDNEGTINSSSLDAKAILAPIQQHGIGWKIYFGVYLYLNVLNFFYEDRNPVLILIRILHLFLSASFLYSWIWSKRFHWLIPIRWLVKIWSIQFFIAPLALIAHGYLAFAKGNTESMTWVVYIIFMYPSLYAIYKLAWKSPLLDKAKL